VKEQDKHMPNGPWVFDADVARVFPDMISRSIPGYATMRESVSRTASYFLDNMASNKTLLDVGSSRGDTIYDILDSVQNPNSVRAVGVDSSPEMCEIARGLFGDLPNVEFIDADITSVDITPGKYGIITSVLTAQFIPLELRQEFFKNVHTGLSFDGAFIIVEKVLGETPTTQSILVDIYHQHKKDRGYSQVQIDEKKKALSGVLVPLRASENEELLRSAGFSQIQRFWQCLNFAGWIALK
jgi:tRNA (cmo5U34)-methyltransferase